MTAPAHLCALTALTLMTATQAQAEQPVLRAALAVLPEAVFLPTGFDIARFVDLAALAEHQGKPLDRDALSRGQAGSGLRPFDAMIAGGPESFAASSGVALEDLRFLAGFGQPPQEVSVWGLATEDSARAALDALATRGFSPAGLPGVIANGAPGAVDFARRDAADPWTGPMGMTSVVTRSGATLLQAANPAAFAPLLGGTTIAGSSTGQTLLAAIESGDGSVLQAAFFGPYVGLDSGVDIADILGKSPEELRAGLEALAETPPTGVPLYSGLVLADIAGPEGDALLIALAYSDCAFAEAAAVQAAALWPDSAGGTVTGEATPAHVDAGAAGCAATVRIPAGDGAPPFQQAMNALWQRDLAAIRIALQ